MAKNISIEIGFSSFSSSFSCKLGCWKTLDEVPSALLRKAILPASV